MTCYSVQPRDLIFVKGYGFLSFAKNIGKNISRNISKNLSCKYSQKILDHTKQSATDALKTASKRVIQEIAEATGDLIGTKISQQINSETVTNERDKEIPEKKNIYIYICDYVIIVMHMYLLKKL